MLLINSWINTVFPTPAPPNNPILPPLINGQIKSTTLIHVSKISVSVLCCAYVGALRWIGIFLTSSPSASFPSIGCPKTLNILPSVALPTGTEIGCLVSIASIPLLTPSVGPIATQRTISSPICCATSTTNKSSPFWISIAVFNAGKLLSLLNWISITGPLALIILPIFCDIRHLLIVH